MSYPGIGAATPLLACTVLFSSLAGCATMINGTTQDVSIVTRQAGRTVYGAQCQVRNSRGSWAATSGSPVMISRAAGDVDVQCLADKLAGSAKVRSSTSGKAVFADFMVDLCTVSCLIDASTGAFWTYPSRINVDLE